MYKVTSQTEVIDKTQRLTKYMVSIIVAPTSDLWTLFIGMNIKWNHDQNVLICILLLNFD